MSIVLAGLVAAAVAAAGGCGSSANRICKPVPSFATPAGQCVAVAAAKPPPPPEPEPEPEPPQTEPPPEPPPPEPPPPEPPAPEPPSEPPSPVVVMEEAIELNRTIQFEAGNAKLIDDSKTLLDEVVKVLDEHPELIVIRIEGHTDSSGSKRGKRANLKLSTKRAQAVRTYLIKHGIAKRRLVAKGFGEGKPIADNDTEEGRLKNQRVDLRIVKRDDAPAGDQ